MGCGDLDDSGKSSNGTRKRVSRLAKRVTRRKSTSINSNNLKIHKDRDLGECKDLHASDSSLGASLDKGKQQALNDSVCSFNNVRKIGEQIGVLWDEVEGPMEGAIGRKDSNVFRSSGIVSGDRFIAVKGSWKGIEGEVVLANIYGYHITEKKVKLWCRISGLIDSVDGVGVYLGISTRLENQLSDHCPIALKDMDLDFGPKPFRAFDFWLEDGKIDKVFKAAWEKPVQTSRPDCMVRDRFKNVKEDLKVWSKAKFGCAKHHIELCKKEAMKWELEAETRSLEEEEMRPRIKWDFEGDENSRFFHNMVKRRCDRNSIRGLMIDGMWCEDPQRIKGEIFRFYKGIFLASDRRRPRFVNNRVPKLSIEDALCLEVSFSKSKVWNTVCGCRSDKAPGPDGFNFKYIKRFWDVIKVDVLRAVRWFWEKGEFYRGCNASFVTLILKVVHPIGLGDYRPISIIGSFYKIIIKNNIGESQKIDREDCWRSSYAFIKGRYILDGVLIANETVEFVKSKKRKSLVFKVDFKKAYDCIEWRYLKEIRERMRFGSKWCKWVASCLKSASILILVNGSPTKEFSIGRGRRIFFTGIRVGEDEVLVSHLQYADDTIIFGEWWKENVSNLMNILKCFEEVSGLKINLQKSKVYDVGVESEELDRMARFMTCGDYRGVSRNVNPVNARNPTVRAYYECGSTDHVRSACRRLNRAQGPKENRPNQVVANNGGQGRGNQGNQARGRAFMFGAEEAHQDPNIMTGTFTLNNHFSTTLFDSGADYSFVSTTFIPLLGLEPSELGFKYDIEIASGQLVEIDKVIKGCKLEIEGHVFDIDLIPFGHGSFDVIIGMDWLPNYKAEIICHEKVVRIPLPDGKVLRVLGEGPEEKARFLMGAKAGDKKQEEIVVVRDFPKVFPNDLSGLPPIWEIKFRIKLITGATPVAKSPYHLAPSELEELS
ncbi:putative reverse transcriptase domain-containing protein [Tanacetum coccineum]|uniref:Reverse transcriptase domain-containing protein n=1 Tax=Tanacetum coccineum TaxID=301880 RepID=A0ABQ4ZCJ4_9ASTR